MEKNITITLSSQEAQALGALLDAAVKAIGLRAAPAASVIAAKLEAASKEPAKESVKDESPK